MGKIKKDSLGDRMKQYESVNDTMLVPKMPFIIRVDGKAFHTFTKGLAKPFDEIMQYAMLKTTESLCKDIPGAVIGYTQSDEITIVCKYTDRIVSQAWFNGRIEKIIAISASKATKYFNKYFFEACENFDKLGVDIGYFLDKANIYMRKYFNAEFDSRVFNMPEWDCINTVIWRQQDATRNSVEAVGHANFSANELHKVTCDGIKEKLMSEKGINWEQDFDAYEKYGAFCIKKLADNGRSKWIADRNWAFIVQNDRKLFAEITGLSED